MPTPEPKIVIGQTFEDQFIVAGDEDEYLGCTFLRCHISYREAGNAKFVDSTFNACVINPR